MVVHRRTSSPAKSGKKKVQLRTQEKIRILDWMKRTGRGQTDAARHFQDEYPGIKQPLISEFVKRQEDIRKLAAEEAAVDSMRSRQVRCPEMEKELGLWITQVLEQGSLRLNGAHIVAKAKKIMDVLKTPDNKRPALSSGWLTRFKRRHGLKSFRFHGEAASASLVDVDGERERLKILTKDWARKDIFNMDETALFIRQVPDRALATKELSKSGVKQDKFRLTVGFCANADGTERMAPIIIGKAKKPRCFNKHTGQQLGFDYHNNKTAWMTGLIFFDWLMRWNEALRKDSRRILLLVDNFSGHTVDTSKLTNIQLEFFKPNLTAHVQPLDAGIIRCFKAKYRTLVINRSLERYEQGEADFYAIDQLVAMRFLLEAWYSVANKTIENCWKHTKILPSDVTPVPQTLASSQAVATEASASSSETSSLPGVAVAEQEASDALDRFYETGAVPRPSRLSINELLNPIEERPSRHSRSLHNSDDNGLDLESNELGGNGRDEDGLDDEIEMVVIEDDESDGDDEEDITVVAPTPLRALGMVAGLVDFTDSQTDPFFRDFARMLTLCKQKINVQRQEAMIQPRIDDAFAPLASP
ncbi:hypothetical protein CF326_g8669 [Tilletia indica]|nr:hypothetical protein CF326_g8669 [Tilletia indica]